MKNFMSSKNLIMGALLLSCLIQSCGKSDATKSYHDLKLVPMHAATENQQTIYSAVFNISLAQDDSASKTPVFLEGEANEVKLNLNILDPEITAGEIVLDKTTQPDGSTLTKSKDEPNVYIFRWTPAAGYIGSGLTRTTPVNFIAHVLNGPAIVSNFTNTFSLSILVEHTQVKPKIVAIDMPQTSDEGVDQTVKIRVQDAAHSGVNQPDVKVVSYTGARNDENHKFDWAAKVTPNQPLVSGPDKDGVFTYSFTMNLKGQTLPLPPSESNISKTDSNASVVNLCFSAIATSKVSQLDSASVDQCTRVQFSAQPPVVYFDGDPDGTIGSTNAVAGQPFTLNFEVKTPNQRGDIQAPQATFSNFASDANGKPKVEEIANPSTGAAVSTTASSDRFYKMSWTPSCKATGSYNVKMRLATNLVGQKKTADITRKIIISSKASSCDVAAAAPAAKTTAATAPAKTK